MEPAVARSDVPRAKSTASINLDAPPSCLEFWPLDEDYIVVGTYSLHESSHGNGVNDQSGSGHVVERQSQRRSGSVIVLRLAGNEISSICNLQTAAAVLDLHFSPHDGSIFAVATSAGFIVLYRISSPEPSSGPGYPPKMAQVIQLQVAEPTTLILSCAWHPVVPDIIGMSFSTGEVVLTRLSSRQQSLEAGVPVPGEPDKLTLRSHHLEAWTMCFTGDGEFVISGGDDMAVLSCKIPDNDKFQACDKLLELHDLPEPPMGVWQDRKIHKAGVTALLPLSEDLILTGSYDDHVRLLSISQGRRGRVLAEKNFGGGVWRLKHVHWDVVTSNEETMENSKFIVLASCMHAGVRLVQVSRSSDDIWSINVIAVFEEHESMNYASDARRDGGNGITTFVSSSFYDRLVCLWQSESLSSSKGILTR